MTLAEFWGCTLITFGPGVVLFMKTVAKNPIKIIILISSTFFWLLSFLLVAISWAIIRQFCDYLLIGALLAVISQEFFRFLFHIVTKRAQVFLDKLMAADNTSSPPNSNDRNTHNDNQNRNNVNPSIRAIPRRTDQDQIQINDSSNRSLMGGIMPLSYVSGLGFGLISASFSMMNVLTDHIGPGTVGFMGDSEYFILVSSLLALAFMFLNISWSVLMSAGIEAKDNKLTAYVILSHMFATTLTFLNKMNYQIIALIGVYIITGFSGFAAFKTVGITPWSSNCRR